MNSRGVCLIIAFIFAHFSGYHCQDPCVDNGNPCNNGGTCGWNPIPCHEFGCYSYICYCPVGYSGRICENDGICNEVCGFSAGPCQQVQGCFCENGVSVASCGVPTTTLAVTTIMAEVDTSTLAASTTTTGVDTTSPAVTTIMAEVDTSTLAASTTMIGVDTTSPAVTTIMAEVRTTRPAAAATTRTTTPRVVSTTKPRKISRRRRLYCMRHPCKCFRFRWCLKNKRKIFGRRTDGIYSLVRGLGKD